MDGSTSCVFTFMAFLVGIAAGIPIFIFWQWYKGFRNRGDTVERVDEILDRTKPPEPPPVNYIREGSTRVRTKVSDAVEIPQMDPLLCPFCETKEISVHSYSHDLDHIRCRCSKGHIWLYDVVKQEVVDG